MRMYRRVALCGGSFLRRQVIGIIGNGNCSAFATAVPKKAISQNTQDTALLPSDYWKKAVLLVDAAQRNPKLLSELFRLFSVGVRRHRADNDPSWLPQSYSSQGIVYSLNSTQFADCLFKATSFAHAENLHSADEALKYIDLAIWCYFVRYLRDDDAATNKFLEIALQLVKLCNGPISGRQYGQAVYGIHNLRASRTPLVTTFLDSLHTAARKQSTPLEFTSVEIANVLYGLQALHGATTDLGDSILTFVTQRMPPNMNLQAIGNCLYGLRSYRSDSMAAEGFLMAMIKPIRSQPNFNNAAAIALSLCGLHACRGDSQAAHAVLNALVPLIEKATVRFTPKEINMALYGLRNFKGNHWRHGCRIYHFMCNQIISTTSNWSYTDITSALYSLCYLTGEEFFIRETLKVLTMKLRSCTVYPNTAEGIANSLFGLHGMSMKIPEVANLVKELYGIILAHQPKFTHKMLMQSMHVLKAFDVQSEVSENILRFLRAQLKDERILTGSEICMILKSMQNIFYESDEILAIISEVGKRIPASPPVDWDASSYSSAIYGLRRMKNDSEPLSSVISALTDKLIVVNGTFTSQQIGAMLYGLQNMKFDANVEKLVMALLPRVQHCTGNWNGQSVANALFGMQQMRVDSFAVQDMLAILADHWSSSDFTLNAQGVSNAMFGLNAMPSCPSLLRVIQVLIPSIAACEEALSAQGTQFCLYSLRFRKCLEETDSKEDVVVNLIRVLVPLVARCKEPIGLATLGHSFTGLQNMTTQCAPVRQLLAALTPHLQRARGCTPRASPVDVMRICNGFRRFGLNCVELEELFAACKPLIVDAVLPQNGESEFALESHDITRVICALLELDLDNIHVAELLRSIFNGLIASKVLHPNDTNTIRTIIRTIERSHSSHPILSELNRALMSAELK